MKAQATRAARPQVELHIARQRYYSQRYYSQRYYSQRMSRYLDYPKPIELIVTAGSLVAMMAYAYLLG